mmetsp:Transcript_17832/g.20341  ORF Transcript_17832/g.20341 Transcript_17832/m.20341 type:complete len:310 (-) Transcript_17832:218-1147(-)
MQSSSANSINFLDQWKPLSLIGTGSTSDVYLVQESDSDEKKVIKVYNSNIKASIAESEAQLLMSLDHPRIVSAFGYYPKVKLPISEDTYLIGGEDQHVKALALEYVSNGELLTLIQSFGRLPEKIAKTYFLQLLDAIEYLHEKNICHLDIKPDNILLDEKYNIKLADFGVAAQIPKNCTVKGVTGTSIYHSPEMLSKQAYDPYQADLFALGMTLFIMVTEKMPFLAAKVSDPIYKLIIDNNWEGFWEAHEEMRSPESPVFSESFKSLIEGMLGAEARKRLSLERIRRHSWVEDVDLLEEQICQLNKAFF